MLDTSGAAQVNNTEAINGASGQSSAVEAYKSSNPFINSVFACDKGAAQGKTQEFYDTVRPRQAGNSLWLNC